MEVKRELLNRTVVKMTDNEIREKIEGYFALVDAGENTDDIQDAVCDFCAEHGERAWDIKQQIETERLS